MIGLRLIVCLILMQSFAASASDRLHWLEPVPGNMLNGTVWDTAADRHDIGDQWLLFAVTLEESGRIDIDEMVLRPWPFTLHRNGTKYRLDSRQDAVELIRKWERKGYTNYDIGPLQINRRWHGHNFPDPADLLDVDKAVDYAASIIAQAHDRFGGTLIEATGRYRAWSNPDLANQYAKRIHIIRIQLPE